ncbi:MAG: ATP-dependent DNA helicase RecG [Thermaurantimonas sp.]|uniref:ATP-dependent DNA helicase RecG n=1 Tax=Thermaurantimonas sp. TaxID=2681568 RepID=UPI0039199D25
MNFELAHTPIEYIKGVGPKRGELLRKELNIHTLDDLLHHFPFRYVDRTTFHTISDIKTTEVDIQLIGKFKSIQESKTKNGRRILTGLFYDDTGSVEVTWFQGFKLIKDYIKLDKTYVLFGRPNYFNGTFSFIHPELEEKSNAEQQVASVLQPVYSTTEKLTAVGLHSKGISKIIQNALELIKGKWQEVLPLKVVEGHQLISREEAFLYIHFPQSEEQLQKARKRLKFEELFFIQISVVWQKMLVSQNNKGFIFREIHNHLRTFYHQKLPYKLTNAQIRVLREIRADVTSGKQMNRLLQGDVGSGKTLVALQAMLMAVDAGFQACMMAPTEILAQQHYQTISEMLFGLPVNVKLLTGSTKTAERREIHRMLEDGSLHILIGTHALIEDTVSFNNLGLAVIDEQHRFGVEQRGKLWKKNTQPPHILVMTATPIPRTLAMTLYGDLEVSVIDELPPGRKPVATYHVTEAHRLRLFGFMKSEIAKGRQIYVVYPLIEESEKLDLLALEQGIENLQRAFPLPDYQFSVVHGRMSPEDKAHEMERFVKGISNIMVATTVIEVGVNVPNATVMVIENAERFGLSQLHQLRGRVGRGAEKSYCILVTGNKLSSDAKVRIETMCRTNDGFEIAEIDLQLRGPGDIMGTRQSGLVNMKIANLATDQHLVQVTRDAALSLYKDDPKLTKPEHRPSLLYYQHLYASSASYAKIS